MAGTIHQAMAYLGLTAEQNDHSDYKHERTGRHHREDFADYDEELYDYEDEQLDTHELGSRPGEYVAAERADLVAAREQEENVAEPVAREASSSSTPFARVERKLTEAPAEEKSEPEALVLPALQQKSENNTPAPSKAEQTTTNYESEDQLRQITTIHPRSYNDAKIIGESFRENIPVIMNVTDMGEAEAKRLVDFSAGLAFALHGSIERVTDKVFLLTPTNLEVLAPEGAEMPVALDADASSLFNQG